MGRHIRFRDVDDDEFVRNAALQVEALNHASANVPADRSRLHVCWGNYEGPHLRDIPLAKILPEVLKAKPMAFLIEAANARHEHEWKLWETEKLPDDKVLIPGVIDSTSNTIEHPELVAQRIVRFARSSGPRARDGRHRLWVRDVRRIRRDSSVYLLEKMRALAEGAALASDQLW